MLLKRWALIAAMLPSLSVAAPTEQVNQDYHMTLYQDVQGSTDGFELFTKLADKKAFFGVTCSIQSPLPLMQVLLFDDQVLSETPKLLKAELSIDGKTDPLALNGVIKVVNTAQEYSNKIRLEVQPERGSSFLEMQQDYMQLLQRLQQGERLSVTFRHRTLEPQTYPFSLKGLAPLLAPRQKVCF